MPKTDLAPHIERDLPRPYTGGRGPDHHVPTGRDGGGGGDDSNEQPYGSRGPRDRMRTARVGVTVALISIFTLFAAIAAALVARLTGEDGAVALHIVVPQVLWVNTLVLACSSATMEVARRHAFREPAVTEEWLGLGTPARRATLPWLALTFLLGCAFLFGQFVAWEQLMGQGLYMKGSPASSFFYLLTGAHALHLCAGLVALGIALFAASRTRPMRKRQIIIDATSWYWHGMGILWLALFFLLYRFR
jgi:cytochrome c oxidase subunit 3